MKKREYSEKIAKAIRSFLTEEGFKFCFDKEKGVFSFSIRVRGRLNYIQFFIPVGTDRFSAIGVFPIAADHEDSDRMTSISEFITRVNSSLLLASFLLNFTDGEIRCKFTVYCAGLRPSRAVIHDSIIMVAWAYMQFGEGLLGVMFDDMTVKEAIACSGNGERLMQKVNGSGTGDDLSGDEPDSFLDWLLSDDEDEEPDDSDDDGDKESDAYDTERISGLLDDLLKDLSKINLDRHHENEDGEDPGGGDLKE